MGKVFRQYGRNLKCKETDVEFFIPKTLQVIHDYKNKDINIDKIIKQT